VLVDLHYRSRHSFKNAKQLLKSVHAKSRDENRTAFDAHAVWNGMR